MPSLGKDLATIRDHLGFSLQDIQHSTKIPLDTLQSIENESIFEEESEIKTYIRSFVRSYAKALKIENDVIVKALNQKETGNYNHLLLQAYPELSKEIPSQAPKTEDTPDTEAEKKRTEEREEKETSASNKKTAPKENKKAASEKSTTSQVDWADVGKRMKKEKKKTPVWLITLFILIILAAIIAYIVYDSEYFEEDSAVSQAPEETVDEANGLSLEISTLSQEDNAETEPAAALEDTLFVTIYAAFDRLEPVRVWSDLKPRNDPYWIEQGTATNFEFENSIRIEGPPERFLLFMNGHRIDNFQQAYFNETENAVELSREIFTSDSDWATHIELDLPEDVPAPDTVTNRPTFN